MIASWPRRSRPQPPLPAPALAPEWAARLPAPPLPSRISGPLQFQPPPATERPRNCCGTDVIVFGHTLCPLAPPAPTRWRDREPQP